MTSIIKSNVEVEESGEYLNIKHDGNLRVSISEEHNELLVYEDGVDDPRAIFDLSTGEITGQRGY